VPLVNLILFTVLALLWPNAALAAGPQGTRPALEIYVKVDEMAVLRGFRNKETGLFPKAGEPLFDAYNKRWQTMVSEVFKEIRRRVPRHVAILPATGKEQNTGMHIDVTVADMSTSCDSVDYYKYLWVRTYQQDTGVTTNWDGLGVRSQQVVRSDMTDREKVRGDIDAWVQIWAQVPYLHLAELPATPDVPAGDKPVDNSADKPVNGAALVNPVQP